MDEARSQILRRVGDLNADMLKRRQALNEEHYYPRLASIQAECAAIGHDRGRAKFNILGDVRFECGYCGATMSNADAGGSDA